MGVTSGKRSRGQRLFQVDQDWWEHLRGRRHWKGSDGSTCLELRWNGCQSIIAGDHPETTGYRWLPNSSPAERELAQAPDWLLEPLRKSDRTAQVVELTAEDAERAQTMLRYISPKSRSDYDGWLQVGMALHHIDPGLLVAWVEWSKQMENFDEEECLDKWEGFADYSGGDVLSIGSLHEWAKEGGYREPTLEEKEERRLIAEQLELTEQLAKGRTLFTLESLLPADLANALAVLNKSLPTDPLGAVMLLLGGYSGLLKLGTRVSSSTGFSKPINAYVAGVMRSGGSKTQAKNRLIDAPAKDIRKEMAKEHRRQMQEWEQLDKKDRPAAPTPTFVHLSDYTPAALSKQLQLNEERGLGQLIIRDELSGLFGALTSDTRSGTGTADAQILEAFDGDGYSAIRIGEAPRHYEACHVSVFGNIQPDILKALINGQDASGKFARFLFVRIPNTPLELRDDDLSDEEIAEFEAAEARLREYAKRFFALPPRVYHFSQEARVRFHAWFHQHQHRASCAGCPSVISALLGKTSAHALRVAGLLHIVRAVAGEVELSARISAATVDQAMAIVDQLTAETEAFHEHEESETVKLMRHINDVAMGSSKPITHRQAKAKGGRDMRNELTASVWRNCIDQLHALGYGEAIEVRAANGKASHHYRAIKPMT